jgi:hypothetical protein
LDGVWLGIDEDADGKTLGLPDGEELGSSDCEDEGKDEGCMLGCMLGEKLGLWVGAVAMLASPIQTSLSSDLATEALNNSLLTISDIEDVIPIVSEEISYQTLSSYPRLVALH